MRIPFLFWNLKQLPRQSVVAELARELQAAIIALVECDINSQVIIDALDAEGMNGFICPSSPAGDHGDIKVFIRIPGAELRTLYDDTNNHFTFRRLVFDKLPDLLLTVVHSQSKRNWNDNDQAMGAVRLSRKIEDIERDYNHRRSVLVGDLNMNPFEAGIVGSEGLHGVMTKMTAMDGHRIVDGEPRHFFYNPMWRFFGERPEGPPGTHFYAASGKPVAYFWHIFDQVLVRPDLVDALKDVRIIDRVGEKSLLDSKGRPDDKIGSDHLPLFFDIDWR